MLLRPKILCISLLLALFAVPVMANGNAIKITNAWVRAAPPTVSMHAAYATLENIGNKPVALIKITSPQFGHIMLHESFIENGMAKMRHVKKLTIKPHETVELAPGGYHLMLMQANSAVETDSQFTFVFHFSNGEAIEVTAPVKRATTHSKDNNHGH